MAAEESSVDADVMTSGGETLIRMSIAETIAAGLDERRDAPRFPLREDCTVLSGTLVHRAVVRDVSTSGAMLHGIRNVHIGSLVRLRLDRMPDHPVLARVRGVSVLGVHLSIEGRLDNELWREALQDVLG